MSGFRKQNCLKCGAIIAWAGDERAMTPRDAKDGTSRVRGKVFIARDGKISTVCHSCSAEVCITDQLRTILGVADKKPAIAKAVVPA